MGHESKQINRAEIKAQKAAVKLSKKAEKRERKLAIKEQKIANSERVKAEKNRQKFDRKQLKLDEKLRLNAEKYRERMKEESEDLALKHTLSKIAREQSPDADWLNLDNAALIFPASETADLSNMFRVSALLFDEVDPVVLQRALNLIVPRFPSLTSALKRGLFWCYLEPSNKPLVLEKQKDYPCRKIAMDARNAIIRVTYFGREIAVEVFHAATDGNGGITFLNSLLACYFKLLGYEINDKTNCLNHLDKPKPEELVDSYQQFYDGEKRPRDKDKKAYRLAGKKLPPGALVTVKGILSSSEINSIAKSRGLTVGQLVTACLIWAIEEDRKFYMRSKKYPVVIGVPTNIRKMYNSKTLRNFVALMHVESDGSSDFDSLCEFVKRRFLEQNTLDYLKGYVNFNVNVQKNKFFRILPLPIKTFAMKIALKLFSDNVTTSTFSNLGRISAPEEFHDKVARYEFHLGGQPTVLTTVCGAAWGDVLVLTFARVIEESGVEKYFFRKLTELGASVVVESNSEL